MKRLMTKAMQFNYAYLVCAYQAQVQRAKAWIDARVEERLVMSVQWALSKRPVQHAIAHSITCSTPIGRMLNDHIESSMDSNKVDADNVHGLERAVESTVEDAFNNFEVDADSVKGLDDAIANAIDDALCHNKNIAESLSETIGEYVIDELIARLKH